MNALSPAPILEARGITKTFGGFVALADVGITVDRGTTHALIGTNGAGKTTLLEIITGRLRADSGQVLFDGEDVTDSTDWSRVRFGLGRSFQVAGVFDGMTVQENVEIAAAASLRRGMVSMLRRSSLAEREQVDTALRATGMDELRSVLAANLAQGDRKRLEIALILALEPTVLVLDEPTAGMSLGETRAIVELLESLVLSRGISLLLVEHDMEVVFRLATKVTVLDQGRFVVDGTPDDVARNAEVRRIYLGGETINQDESAR